MRIARVNGVLIHYADRGRRDGPVLVFANSLGTDFRIWDNLIPYLESRFRVILYDKRGHGLSEAPPPPYRMADHVADLAALLDYLRIDSAIPCGVSVGGMIALGLAGMHPDLVKGLALCDTAHKIGTPERWQERIASVRENGTAPLLDNLMTVWLSEKYRRDEAEQVARWRHMVLRTPIDGYIGTCAAIAEADYTAYAENIGVPTLVVCGEEDGSTPVDVVRGLANLIPGARFDTIPNAAHLPGIDAPKALAHLVNDFVAMAGLD